MSSEPHPPGHPTGAILRVYVPWAQGGLHWEESLQRMMTAVGPGSVLTGGDITRAGTTGHSETKPLGLKV